MGYVDWAHRVAKEFEYNADDVRKATTHFIHQMVEGLGREDATLSQIPSYVTAVPDGTEKGLYLAVDLGGTNLRVCSVDLHGDTTFSITQSKVAIPPRLMMAKTASELFAFLAKQIELFLELHHTELLQAHHANRRSSSPSEAIHQDSLLLGFTFSFAFEQQALNRGTLLRWTKGFNIPDAIGQDICSLFQVEIDHLHLPVLVVALVNDTVGTLLARSYTSPGKTKTLLGAIFGTGTNGAYVERLGNITKLSSLQNGDSEEMIVNTEWGSFDNELFVLPNTSYDQAVDTESVHPGIQMFEKRISGMYLGEILRHTILAMASGNAPIAVTPSSPLSQQFAIDSSFLSMAAADDSNELLVLRQQLKQSLGIDAGRDIAEAVKILALAIGKRAARLAGVAIAGVVLKSGRLSADYSSNTTTGHTKGDADLLIPKHDLESRDGIAVSKRSSNHIVTLYRHFLSFVRGWTRWLFSWRKDQVSSGEAGIIDIGVDGSLIEFYPGFEASIRSTLREIKGIGPHGEKRIRIGVATDGSGVGAALVARMAQQERSKRVL